MSINLASVIELETLPAPEEPVLINGHVLSEQDVEILKEMNLVFAHVVIGGQHKIMTFKPCAVDGKRMTYESVRDFYNYFSHLDQIAQKNRGQLWFKWRDKTFYSDGIGYYPNQDKAPAKIFNTFQGFGCGPKQGDISLILRHIKEVLCGGDAKAADYFLMWIAHVFQKPEQKPSVAILMKSEQGTGKGTIYKLLKKMLGANAHQVNGHYQLTGRFNSVIAGRLLIFGDEVDLTSKAVFDRAKSIISEPTLSLELKGIDAAPVPNFARFIFAGNHERLICAGTRERRFLVLEPSSHMIDDRDYWIALNEQIDGTGAENFLYYLLEIDLSKFNPYSAPATKGLIEEKLGSLTASLSFLFEELSKDKPFKGASRLYATQLVSSYQDWGASNNEKISLASARSQVGKMMVQCKIKALGRSDVGKGKFYDLPERPIFQESFAKCLGHERSDIF